MCAHCISNLFCSRDDIVENGSPAGHFHLTVKYTLNLLRTEFKAEYYILDKQKIYITGRLRKN
jgi:hypothetical protein